MNPETQAYNDAQNPADRVICDLLAAQINRCLPEAENRIWHAHPVWFIENNPVVGYSALKQCVRLLFWSGQSFTESGLSATGRFKAAEARYTTAEEIRIDPLQRWLVEARDVQWDYRSIVRRKGVLLRLK